MRRSWPTACALALCGWRAHASTVLRPDVQTIRREIDDILSSREFHLDRRDEWLYRLTEMIADAIDRLREVLREFFGGLGLSPDGASALGRVTSWAVWGLVAVAAVYLVVLVMRWIGRRSLGAEMGAGSVREADSEPLVLAPGRPVVLRSRAAEAAERGDLRQAVRLYFLAYLAWLAEAGLIEFSPRRTNGDYVTDFAQNASRRQQFADAARAFERIWYGSTPASREDVAWLEPLSRGDEGRAA